MANPPRTLVEALSRELGADRVLLDPEPLAGPACDEAEWAEAGDPAAAVRVRSEQEVSTRTTWSRSWMSAFRGHLKRALDPLSIFNPGKALPIAS